MPLKPPWLKGPRFLIRRPPNEEWKTSKIWFHWNDDKMWMRAKTCHFISQYWPWRMKYSCKCLFVDIFLLCGPELRRYLQNWIMWLMKIFEVLTSRSNPWDESVKYVGLMSQKTYKKCDDGLTHFFGVFGPKMRSIKSVKLNLYKKRVSLSLSYLLFLLFCIFTKKSLPHTLLTMPCP